jgi:hypothetical protein
VDAVMCDARTPAARERALHILESLTKILPTTPPIVRRAIKTLENQ